METNVRDNATPNPNATFNIFLTENRVHGSGSAIPSIPGPSDR